MAGVWMKKTFFVILVILIILIASAIFFRQQIQSFFLGGGTAEPSPTPGFISTPAPTPTPNPLTRSDWSFEVLNGSGETGLAKKVAEKLTGLGYQVVKTGNAGKSDYTETQFFVNKDMQDKADLVIADLKDTFKIASVAGDLKDSTVSARIIIGKDNI